MKFLIFVTLLAASTAFAKKDALVTNSESFNSFFQQQQKAQKELLNSLHEEIVVVPEKKKTDSDKSVVVDANKKEPEVIVLGESLDLINSDSADDVSGIVFTEKEASLQEKPIVSEQKQFHQLGEELSQAK